MSGETRAFGQSAGAIPASSSPSTALENLPAGIVFLFYEDPRRGVPITASGPQGEQPLLYMNNAGKGSRQIGPVTLGKGLALVLRGSSCRVWAFLDLLSEREEGVRVSFLCSIGESGSASLDDAHSMQQTRTATGKGNPTV